MTGEGIAQIVLYAVILTAMAYPLGIYMARVYAGTYGFVNGRLAIDEGKFTRSLAGRVLRHKDAAAGQ